MTMDDPGAALGALLSIGSRGDAHVRTRVKICGITRAEDAGLAAAAGADAIGFVFWPKSPRAVTPAQAAAIWTRRARSIARVGVFVNESPAVVRDVVRDARLDGGAAAW